MKRSGKLVRKCFNSYLLPMILLNVGVSLSEFVDSIVVSKLLGEGALVVVNVCMPLVLAYATIACLFGIGGSVRYANLLGERQPEEANRIFSASCLVIALLGALFGVAMFFSAEGFALHFSSRAELLPDMIRYIRATAFIGIPYMFVTCSSSYLTSAGNPKLSSMLVVVANVINVFMDVFYIRVLGTGVEGSAYATFTGYLIAAFLFFALRKRTALRFVKTARETFVTLLSVIGIGMAAGLGQIGCAFKFSAMSLLGNQYAGYDGQIVASLCIQTISIVSLVIGGVLQSFLPIVATLKGEEDYRGIRLCIRHAYLVMMGVMLVIVLLFELFPEPIGSIYNITSPSATVLTRTGFRIFSLVHLFRATALFLMYYDSSGGYKRLALSISILDSFLVIPLAMLLCRFFGINGLWAAFPITAVLCLLWIAGAAQLMNRRQKGKTAGLLMLPTRTQDVPVLDVTIEDTLENAEHLSTSVIAFLKENGCREKICVFSGILVEELAVYITSQTEQITFLDVLIKVYDEKISMCFRSDGKPLSGLNRLEVQPEEQSDAAVIDNRQMLHKLADKLDYARLLGMNSVSIELGRKV